VRGWLAGPGSWSWSGRRGAGCCETEAPPTFLHATAPHRRRRDACGSATAAAAEGPYRGAGEAVPVRWAPPSRVVRRSPRGGQMARCAAGRGGTERAEVGRSG